MDIANFLKNWIDVSNLYNTDGYLDFFLPDAVLDDPSVGSKFIGHEGITEYYTSYFMGYNTQTRIVKITIKSDADAFIEVEFTGDFPQKKIGGTFDIHFLNGKISSLTADLI